MYCSKEQESNDDAVRSVKLLIGALTNAIAEVNGNEVLDFVNEDDKNKAEKKVKEEKEVKEEKKEAPVVEVKEETPKKEVEEKEGGNSNEEVKTKGTRGRKKKSTVQ